MPAVQAVDNNFPLVLTEQVFRGDVDPYLAQDLTLDDPRDPKQLITAGPSQSVTAFEGNAASLQPEGQPPTGIRGPSYPRTVIVEAMSSQPKREFRTARNRDNVFRFNDGVGIGEDWFERLHLFPKEANLGNVVSSLSIAIDIYSSYRNTVVTLIDIDNQLSSQGVTIGGAPSLPTGHPPQTSIPLTLEIAQVGPPNISGDVIFDYNVQDIFLPVTGTRVILFEYMPQREVREELEWKTDIIKSADGTEMRISTRKNPRQFLRYNYVMRSQRDLNSVRSLLTEWQPRVFGVPLWFWARKLTADVSAGATSVTVASTDNADFRIGGLCMIAKQDPNDLTRIIADVVEIASFGSPNNTINFTSSLTSNFEVLNGAIAAPVVAGIVPSRIELSRQGTEFAEFQIPFQSVDNTADLSDASAFGTYRNKVVIDDPNFLPGRGAYRESFQHKNTRVDEQFGKVEVFSSQTLGVQTRPKRWINNDNAEEWQRRQLMYALRGKQVSFFLPSFQKDMTITGDVSSGASTIDIENIGYTNFVQARTPFKDIEIELTDGSILRHRITGSAEISPGERLSIDPVTSTDFLAAEVVRVSYLTLSRFDTDTARITHRWTDLDGDKKESEIALTTIGVSDDA